MTIKLTDIKADDRMRSNLGNIEELANSILTLGLLQPIRLNDNNELIVGGRRLAALKHLGITDLDEGKHFTRDSNPDPFFLRQAELEENVRRLDMAWTEKIASIAAIHSLRRGRSVETGEQWLQSHTGALLNMSQANVSIALAVSAALKAGDEEMAKCASLRDALALMLKRKEALAVAALAKAAGVQMTNIPSTPTTIKSINGVEGTDLQLALEGEVRRPTISPTLNDRFILGDCLEVLAKLPNESIPHIISDPPYGIEMDNLDQQNQGILNIDLVAETHDVEENKDLFSKTVPEFFRVLRPSGFCVLFCDATNFSLLEALGVAAGFAVQRWPLVWLKTHQCMNQMAGFNFTKNYELAIVMRKKDARLVSQQNSSVYACSGMEGREKFQHPFVKPAKLWQWIFSAVLTKSDWFLDPFMGEGSSILAGLTWGITPMGIEISEPLHNRALMHISEAITQPVV